MTVTRVPWSTRPILTGTISTVFSHEIDGYPGSASGRPGYDGERVRRLRASRARSNRRNRVRLFQLDQRVNSAEASRALLRPARERPASDAGAEGATAPETLRQRGPRGPIGTLESRRATASPKRKAGIGPLGPSLVNLSGSTTEGAPRVGSQGQYSAAQSMSSGVSW